jgi:hypothetical protein
MDGDIMEEKERRRSSSHILHTLRIDPSVVAENVALKM